MRRELGVSGAMEAWSDGLLPALLGTWSGLLSPACCLLLQSCWYILFRI